jgi:cell division septum initiation protein DivIVA
MKDFKAEVDRLVWEYIVELQEENRKLKEKVRFLEECLDRKEKVNKSLREELSKLKEKYWDIDY